MIIYNHSKNGKKSNMIEIENLVLGAGISGLAAGQRLKELGKDYLILEQRSSYGGLCDNFEIDGFRFDRFVHFSFAEEFDVRKFFDQVEFYRHIPNAYNYYHGLWIKHPAQNNLFPLSEEEKQKILQDMENRPVVEQKNIKNYEQWLRTQFGNYFAENFPMIYTKKYWGVEAKDLETKWVGNRVYQPSMDEVLEGMKTSETPVTYYAKEMRYPKNGGFKSFLKAFANEEKIRYNQEVISIDTDQKIVKTKDNQYHYINLYSSIPLNEYSSLLSINNDKVVNAISNLHCTSGYIVSLGMKGELIKKDLWDYIYDKDILPARIYSPSEKSSNNVPDGCSSIQAEIYYRDDQVPSIPQEQMLEDVINQLDNAHIIDKTKLVVKDIRFEKYANVVFDESIYFNRNIVIKYLKKKNINLIGRFGEWAYLWTNQSFLSGYQAIKQEDGE